jgi:CRISPR/Cas system-associated exonuclease Cas4 (RecB family)
VSLDELKKLLSDAASADTELILLVMLSAIAFIIFDNFNMMARRRRKQGGFGRGGSLVQVDGARSEETRMYFSEVQGLAGKPDALISEDGFLIPVERKPLAKKLRDRYIAQLLVYMRLVEECEGKKPPYGYLLLGPQCRRVRIYNTAEKQAWLQTKIDEMRGILKGDKAIPDPHPRKCPRCTVQHACEYKVV